MKGNLLAVPMLAVAVLAVPVLALILATAAPASPEAGSTPFSPEALLAADAPWAAVQAVAGTSFWPEPPAFDSIVDEEDPQPLTAVSQSYDELGGSAKITTQALRLREPRDQPRVPPVERDRGRANRRALPVGRRAALLLHDEARRRHAVHPHVLRARPGGSVDPGQRSALEPRADRAAGRPDRPADPGSARRATRGARDRGAGVPHAALEERGSRADPRHRLAAARGMGDDRAQGLAPVDPRRARPVREHGDPVSPLPTQGSRTDVLETTLFTFPTIAAAQAWIAPFSAGVKSHPADMLAAGATGSAFRVPARARQLRAPVRRRAPRRGRLLLGALCRESLALV